MDREKAAAGFKELLERLDRNEEKQAFLRDVETVADLIWDIVIEPRLERMKYQSSDDRR